MPLERSEVGTLWSTTARVRSGERTLRPALRRADLAAGDAQPLEGLRARHLMDEVAVDIEERVAVGLRLDDMVVPDLVVKRARGHGSTPGNSLSPWCLAEAAKPEKSGKTDRLAGLARSTGSGNSRPAMAVTAPASSGS